MSRDIILKAVRTANAQQGMSGKATRRQDHDTVTIENAAQGPVDTQSEFSSRLQACGVIVERLGTQADVPSAVLRFVTAARVPLVIRHGNDPDIAALPWHETPSLQRRTGAASPDDLVTLSRAHRGIAETGTLLLASGADNPVTLAFLPELHIVLIDAARVVQTIDGALACLRDAQYLPRTINLISGASRTGDIGGRLVMGAHGPRQLVVLLVGRSNENGAL